MEKTLVFIPHPSKKYIETIRQYFDNYFAMLQGHIEQ